MIYQLRTPEGKILGYTEEPRYIKVHKTTGCFVQATKEDAQGIAYKSVAYNFYGHHWFKHAPHIILREVDGAEYISDIEKQNIALEEQLAETDMAAIYLYETSLRQEVRDAEQDEAIIQIYEMIKE